MKYEKEVKILDINIFETEKKLQKLGANLSFKTLQRISVYDLPSIYSRYLDIYMLWNSSYPYLKVLREKLRLLLFELKELLSQDDIGALCRSLNVSDLMELLKLDDSVLKSKLNSPLFDNKLKSCLVNQNKWIRLRESNGKVELTCKHILKDKLNFFQNVLESEIATSSFDETDKFLENIGLFKRNYQEKYRIQYLYKGAEIDIDQWPYLLPYMEIETENEKLIKEIIEKCNLSSHEIVSLNTEELYRRIGINVLKIPELYFEKQS